MEQEAIVSRIWALGAVAGHRSHEGANAHSALVDWSWLYPPPTTTPPPLSLYLVLSPLPQTVFMVIFPDFLFYLIKPHLSSVNPAALLQRAWNRSITICMVARIVQQVSNESLPHTNTFHKSTTASNHAKLASSLCAEAMRVKRKNGLGETSLELSLETWWRKTKYIGKVVQCFCSRRVLE